MARPPWPIGGPAPLGLGVGAALASVLGGAVHVSVIREHFAESTLYGVFFTVLAGAQVGWAVWLVARPGRGWLVAGAVAAVAVVLLWLATRTVGIPLGPAAGETEPVGSLDALASAAELVVAVCAYLTLRTSALSAPAGTIGGCRAPSDLVLRRWTDADREPFAALNADPVVMEHFVAPLTRVESDALVDRIEAGFAEHGFGLWVVEADGTFLGFTGLILQTFDAPFTPAVEVGWRLNRPAWGHGYATEAARAALAVGFDEYGSTDVVSMTAPANTRSQAVMRRLGMHRDPADDFDHPRVPDGHRLKRHVLYRLTADEWRGMRGSRSTLKPA